MSVTPNRHLPLMEPSQSEPEVVYNAAMEILDVAETLEVEHLGASPGVRGVTKIKFSGASVTDLGGGVIEVTIDGTSGAGGGSLELTDGTHDLTGVTKITVSGATVGGVAGAATLTVTGAGGTAGLLCNDAVPLTATNVGFDSTSVCAIVSGNSLNAAAFSSIKVRLQINSGSGVVGSAVARAVPHGSTTFSSSTPILWGGVGNPTLGTGNHDSDAIAVSIDKDSDIWIIIYFDSSGANTTLGLGQGAAYAGSLVGGYAAGDKTAVSTTFTITSPPNIFGIGQVFGG